MINLGLCTKFKVPACSRDEDMNGGAKCTIWGSLGQLEVTRGHPHITIRWSASTSYSTLTETMRLFVPVSRKAYRGDRGMVNQLLQFQSTTGYLCY